MKSLRFGRGGSRARRRRGARSFPCGRSSCGTGRRRSGCRSAWRWRVTSSLAPRAACSRGAAYAAPASTCSSSASELPPWDTSWASGSRGLSCSHYEEGGGARFRVPYPSHRSSLFSLEIANPNVPEPHRMLMILQSDRQAIGPRLVRRPSHVRRRPDEFDIVLHEHAVVQNGETGGLQQFPGGVEARPVKHDVVALPLAPLAAHVPQWRGSGLRKGNLLTPIYANS